MTDLPAVMSLPAVVEAGQQITDAQERGDATAANDAYRRQLALMADAMGDPRSVAALREPAVIIPKDRSEAVMGALEVADPESAAELRRLWPGAELHRNLAFATWATDRYAVPEPADESFAALLHSGVVLARGVFAELHGGADAPPPIPEADRRALQDDEPGSIPGAADLGFVRWLINTYAGGTFGGSEADVLRLAAAVGRGVYADLKNGRPAPERKEQKMEGEIDVSTLGETAFEDHMSNLRGQIEEAMQKGNHTRANRLYQEEQETLARRHGNAPIVNGRRTV